MGRNTKLIFKNVVSFSPRHLVSTKLLFYSSKSFKVISLKPTAEEGDHAEGVDGVHLTGGVSISRLNGNANGKFQ